MNKLACQYALLRFRPFVETGEFAIVGVVLLSPEGRFFGYKLLKKYGRITQFFHQLDHQVYLNGKALFSEELDRFAAHLLRNALDGRKRVPDIALATGLFAELTRPRDAMLHFDECRVVLAADPQAKLDELIRADLAAGRTPIAVVATAGTTLTGAIDPLDAIADICAEHGIWMHVDGAYGLPAASVMPERFAGLERADSVRCVSSSWCVVLACSASISACCRPAPASRASSNGASRA